MTNEKQILNDVAETVLNQPVKISVDVAPKNKTHAFLQRINFCEKKREFTIYPLCMGAMIRASKELLSIDVSIFDFENLLESNYKSIVRDSNAIARVLAISITNAPEDQKSESRIIKFILRNFNSKEMLSCLKIVLKQMDVTSFMSSIISAKGLNLLNAEMSRKQPKETIAFGEQSGE